MTTQYAYTTHDGGEYVIRADSQSQAEMFAKRAELNRTGSVACANIAASRVAPLLKREDWEMYRGSEGVR